MCTIACHCYNGMLAEDTVVSTPLVASLDHQPGTPARYSVCNHGVSSCVHTSLCKVSEVIVWKQVSYPFTGSSGAAHVLPLRLKQTQCWGGHRPQEAKRLGWTQAPGSHEVGVDTGPQDLIWDTEGQAAYKLTHSGFDKPTLSQGPHTEQGCG